MFPLREGLRFRAWGGGSLFGPLLDVPFKGGLKGGAHCLDRSLMFPLREGLRFRA